ncbi:PREDICTED: uncharacterized protein LOC108753843 [Trachymyrmex septentrionalis]|uniref:uncharacterized protein LOC108753843 n=1 Tax=Trachymyrmex septentrionalis TaxID=34720 RepID=UPI00084F48E1|nr:PREDICTED: uncharacterized protein LOC108753843 [Trachymyrmex septentrionalis]
MLRLLFFVLLIFSAVSAESCISQNTKDPDIRVIEFDDSSKDFSESDIVALHFPDRRRREIIEVKNEERSSSLCKNDDDCDSGLICLAHLTCIKGIRRAGGSSENSQLKMDNAVRK